MAAKKGAASRKRVVHDTEDTVEAQHNDTPVHDAAVHPDVLSQHNDEACGSGQSPASLAADVAAQPALLAAAAANVAERNVAGSSAAHASLPPKAAVRGGTHKSAPKKRKLEDLHGFADLANGGSGGGGGGGGGGGDGRRGKKAIEAVIKLGRHMQGPKRGQLSGSAFYAINCEFAENDEIKKLLREVLKEEPKFIKDWGKWAVRAATAQLALKMHAAVLRSTKAPVTAKEVNKALDVTAFDNAAIEKPHFTLVTSETEFETQRDGVLPRSTMIAGKVYPFKEYLKDKFPEIRYTDLVFNGGAVTKAAWVLPSAAQTSATGTLAEFVQSLGVTVEEVDLDEDEDEDDDADRDEEALVDDEAEEAGEDEEEENGEM